MLDKMNDISEWSTYSEPSSEEFQPLPDNSKTEKNIGPPINFAQVTTASSKAAEVDISCLVKRQGFARKPEMMSS